MRCIIIRISCLSKYTGEVNESLSNAPREHQVIFSIGRKALKRGANFGTILPAQEINVSICLLLYTEITFIFVVEEMETISKSPTTREKTLSENLTE